MQKKLIGFNETLLEKIEKYSQEKEITFTEAVRQLIELGLKAEEPIDVPDEVRSEGEMPDIETRIADLEKKIIDFSWWNADDFQSRLGNAELAIKELQEIEKKVNILVGVSKNFKGHIENREIHLQD
jgi:tetrahydromethanopterin S-methyltransferase subunit G